MNRPYQKLVLSESCTCHTPATEDSKTTRQHMQMWLLHILCATTVLVHIKYNFFLYRSMEEIKTKVEFMISK